jgi:hypothetical protein
LNAGRVRTAEGYELDTASGIIGRLSVNGVRNSVLSCFFAQVFGQAKVPSS